ncbi:hypothetical protein [Methylotuvimicrobium sp. KM1]|uniref:hypothetical protein n=1 Tax=Methylotuvimicrobium sp. KM1 TaxID=3377707 RepID=UPI00384D84DD
MPFKTKDFELLDCFDQFFRQLDLEIIGLNATVIDIATELQVNHSGALRTLDAIKLACAETFGADRFLTGDKKAVGY